MADPSSIESNIIIIASCIPTLGPLYEILRGKRSWSSHQNYYQSSGNKIPSSTGDRHFKKYALDSHKDADLFTTNIGTNREGSQESILRDEANGSRPTGKIQRTDQVVVEYEMRDMDREGRPSW